MARPSNLHEACYAGDVVLVRALLDAGADPNGPADPPSDRWVSTAGNAARPLNCVVMAWTMTTSHLEIARLLIERGARVDRTVVRDHEREMTGSPTDTAMRDLLRTAIDAGDVDLARWMDEGHR